MVDINIQTVLEMLSQIIGIEGAEKIIDEAIREADLRRQAFYSEDEFQRICECLGARGGSLKLFASLVLTSDYREKQYQRIIDKERREKEELAQLYARMEELNRELQHSNETLKKTQEELLRAEKLAVIGTLASSVAHELRNPLSSIKNVKFFLARYLKADDPKAGEFISILSKEIDRMDAIITELLDYARIKNFSPVILPVRDLLEQSLADIPLPPDVSVVKAFSPEMKQVSADPSKMRQAFVNFINNACDAMANRGTLTISTGINNECDPGREYVSISFKDTGCGMSREVLSRVFEPLYTTKTKGIGLGLPIVKNIVEGHGGKILVESEEGKGTVFTVLLPAEKA